ncbi:MAG TPA: class D sortase [Vicinamibacterales bacterium]|jgi:sortase A
MDRRGLRTMERLLFVVAALALAWYAGVTIAAAREQAALSSELDRDRAALVTGTGAPTGPAARAPAPPAARSLVARIEIPRLRVATIAREGVDSGTLRASAGHVPGTALPGEIGNAAFAAHRDTFFRPLQGIRRGDEIAVTTPLGVFRYQVTGTRIVDPDETSVLDRTPDATLTLVTCYPFDYVGSAPQRFIVHARMTSASD